MRSLFRQRTTMSLAVFLLLAVTTGEVSSTEPAVVDASTMRHKVMCGYQGWFRCPGDLAKGGWRHWSRDGRRISERSLTFEMWPEMSEYGADERFAASGFTMPDGKPAELFSSTHPATVDRHFAWMRQYGIDGAFLQRFLVETGDPGLDLVLKNVRAAAKQQGRAYAIGYDLSGMPAERIFDRLTKDWKRLVDEEQITKDKQYLHHQGKPVLFVWGFFSDRFSAELGQRIIDFFHDDPKYAVTMIGGCQWHWRTEKDAAWQKVFRQMDVISPWNVGHVGRINGQKQAATHYWADDLTEVKAAGREYLPVIYPGFGWTNLQGAGSAGATIPRLGGEFFWKQFVKTKELGIEMAYVAMFDEVDEATAIFKVSNSPPTPGKFQTYDGLPNDWYLRLTGEGTKLLRGEIPPSEKLPIKP